MTGVLHTTAEWLALQWFCDRILADTIVDLTDLEPVKEMADAVG